MSNKYNELFDSNGKFKVDKSKPRGIRNNNIGNLIKTDIAWQGKVEHSRNSDGHFEQFYEPRFGTRAMIKDLINDINKGKNTLTKLISEFAPKHENDTTAYVNRVSKMSGISPNQKLSINYSTLSPIVRSMAKVENGVDAMSENEFKQAWDIIGSTFTETVQEAVEYSKKNWIPVVSILTVTTGVIYAIYKYNQFKK